MLLYVSDPAERILDLTLLDADDVVVKLQRLRTALAVTVSVYCLLVRLKERLVYKLVDRSDNHSCTALSNLLESRELLNRNRSSLNLHSEMSCHSLERLVGD